MATSRKQINGENSSKSTGPRSVEGKEIARWNAVTHGLLAKEVVIRRGEGREDATEFARLLATLHEDLAPVGCLECLLVERIAVSHWRLRRVVRYEVGTLRENLDEASARQAEKRRESFKHAMWLLLNQGKRDGLLKSSMGLSYLLGVLEEVHEEVVDTRSVSSDLLRKCSMFPRVKIACEEFTRVAVTLNERDAPTPDVLDASLSNFLEVIGHEATGLESLLKSARYTERLEDERHRAESGTPSEQAMGRILRYEGAIERQLYRAATELQRLQRQRAGDRVLAPFSVDVATE